MKKIIAILLCMIFSLNMFGCSTISNLLEPELAEKDKQYCIEFINFFTDNVRNLNGDKVIDFVSNPDVLTYVAALDKNGGNLSAKQVGAYWSVVLMGDILLKGKYCDITDEQLQKMHINVNVNDMRGVMDTRVVVGAKLSFDDNSFPEEYIDIILHIEKDMMSANYIPKIDYIKVGE